VRISFEQYEDSGVDMGGRETSVGGVRFTGTIAQQRIYLNLSKLLSNIEVWNMPPSIRVRCRLYHIKGVDLM
jgi:hypothetical protein